MHRSVEWRLLPRACQWSESGLHTLNYFCPLTLSCFIYGLSFSALFLALLATQRSILEVDTDLEKKGSLNLTLKLNPFFLFLFPNLFENISQRLQCIYLIYSTHHLLIFGWFTVN